MKYKIGTVAKLLGVAPETLRMYERHGILPMKREHGKNSYRYYSRLDITALLRARAYHEYGFTMGQTRELLNTGDVMIALDGYRERERELAEEIRRKQHMLAYLGSISALVEGLPQSLWQIRRAVRPGIYRLEFMRGDELVVPTEKYALFQSWASLAPFAFTSQRNRWDALLDGVDDSFSALGVMEDDAAALGMPPQLAEGTYYKPCSCLYTIVELSGEHASCTDYLAHLAAYVRENGVKVTGDCICRTFLSLNKKDDYRRYREVWLPCEA